MSVLVFIFDDLAEARDLINASARKQVWVAMDKPRRFIADIVAKPDAAFFTDASGQHRTNDRKLEMALASRS